MAAHPGLDRAIKEAPSDPAALYVAGQAALLSGDIKAAVVALRGAVEHEPRPNYVVALAQARPQSKRWRSRCWICNIEMRTPLGRTLRQHRQRHGFT